MLKKELKAKTMYIYSRVVIKTTVGIINIPLIPP